jgi:hypothetical protein
MNIPTPIADMITEMHASGVQLDMIIVAVRSMERALSTRHRVDEVAEKRRAWDREYRRNKREHPPDPPDIHPIPPDVGNIALSLEDKKERILSVKEERKQERKKERGSKCPPDWKPNQHHYDEGAKLGMSSADVDERASRMRLWCEANANRSVTTKANWDSTFTGTWLKDSRNGNASGNTRTHQASGSAPTRDAAVIASLGRTLDRRRAARAADRSRDEELFGNVGAAGESAADTSAAPSDNESHRKFALVAASNARRW